MYCIEYPHPFLVQSLQRIFLVCHLFFSSNIFRLGSIRCHCSSIDDGTNQNIEQRNKKRFEEKSAAERQSEGGISLERKTFIPLSSLERDETLSRIPFLSILSFLRHDLCRNICWRSMWHFKGREYSISLLNRWFIVWRTKNDLISAHVGYLREHCAGNASGNIWIDLHLPMERLFHPSLQKNSPSLWNKESKELVKWERSLLWSLEQTLRSSLERELSIEQFRKWSSLLNAIEQEHLMSTWNHPYLTDFNAFLIHYWQNKDSKKHPISILLFKSDEKKNSRKCPWRGIQRSAMMNWWDFLSRREIEWSVRCWLICFTSEMNSIVRSTYQKIIFISNKSS